MRDLSAYLAAQGWIAPWLDEEKLLPGQNWDIEIKKAVRAADAIIVFLSDISVKKEGYIQKELRFALDLALEKPEEEIFIVPVRIDDCFVPESLKKIHHVDYFPPENKDSAFKRIIASLEVRARRLGIASHPGILHPREQENLQNNKVIDRQTTSRGDCAGTEKQLTLARRLLGMQEEQESRFTPATFPAHMRLELEDQKKKVAELEAKLKECLED